jgi:hypothetical protein
MCNLSEKQIQGFLNLYLSISILLLSAAVLGCLYLVFPESEEEYYFETADVYGEWVPTQNTISTWLKDSKTNNYHLIFREDGTFAARLPGPLIFSGLIMSEPDSKEWNSVYSFEGKYELRIGYDTSSAGRGNELHIWGKITKEQGDINEAQDALRPRQQGTGTHLNFRSAERSYIKGKTRFHPKRGEPFDLFFYVGDPDEYFMFAFEPKTNAFPKTNDATVTQ